MESGIEGPPPLSQRESKFSAVKKLLGRITHRQPQRIAVAPTPTPEEISTTFDRPSQAVIATSAATPEEKSRTFGGRLPENSNTQPLNRDTDTYVEHGEKTWTTAQTVRDILQNHLDANTQQFFDQLVSAVVDTNRLTKTGNNEDIFDDFTYDLFRFRKGLGSFSPDAEQDMIDLLNHNANSITPLRSSIVDENGKIKLDALKQAVAPIIEEKPQITYLVNKQWLTYDQLQQSEYADQNQYLITGIKIEDQGKGFDAKLSAFYKTTKRGKRHLRGKFGEGSKMSAAHLMRHGAYIKMRSRFEINGGQPVHERIWQHRALLGEEKTILQKGIQVDLPPGQNSNAGSFTQILIDKANHTFQQDFRTNVDPRIKGGGLAQNCLDYSQAKYYYPMSKLKSDEKPVGVSLEVFPDNQYVQGLRVGSDETAGQELTPIFSYDFLDSSILQGRDRNELKGAIQEEIQQFWTHADSPALITELIRRVVASNHPEYTTPEEHLLNRILSGIDISGIRHTGIQIERDTQKQRTTACALAVFPHLVDAKQEAKNVIIQN